MKNQKHDFSLIDNTYSAEGARAVITSLISDKIKFLNTEMLSINERFGTDVEHMKERVRQLEADKARMISLFSDYINQDIEIEISCEVKMVAKHTASVNG